MLRPQNDILVLGLKSSVIKSSCFEFEFEELKLQLWRQEVLSEFQNEFTLSYA